MEIETRLQRARREAGYPTPSAAAAAMGANVYTYSQHENGTRGLRAQVAERYATFFRVDTGWLLTGKGKMHRRDITPLVGYIGQGQRVFPPEKRGKGSGFDFIEAGSIPSEAMALVIKGDSMYPMGDGWILIYQRSADDVPSTCLNALCVAQLADNGPILVKIIRPGREAGTYSLESWNAPLLENQHLDWAAPVKSILPR